MKMHYDLRCPAQALPILICLLALAGAIVHPGQAQDLKLAAAALTDRAESPLAGISVFGDLAFVGGMSTGYYSADNLGIRIVDLSDPTQPTLVGRIPLRAKGFLEDHAHGDAEATYVATDAFEGTVAAVLDGVPDSYIPSQYPEPIGLWDVSDPANPVFLSVVNFGMAPHGSEGSDMGDKPFNARAMHDHYLFALYEKGPRPTRDFRLGIADIADPLNPVIIADWQDDPRTRLHSLSLNEAGTRAYITGVWSETGQAGRNATHRYLYILDVSDPTSPAEIGRYVWPQTGVISSLWRARPAKDDTIVILTDGTWEQGQEGALHILDVSDPAAIVRIAEFDTETDRGMATDLVVRGNMVYSVWLKGSVVAVNITDPQNPKAASEFRSLNLSDIALLGDGHVVTTGVWRAGLYVLQDQAVASGAGDPGDLPDAHALRQNYPNPFNPSTEIAFDLATPSHDVRLAIYDVTGREVAVLVDGAVPAGRHEVSWDAGSLSSGLYLYRLTSSAFTETRAMVLHR